MAPEHNILATSFPSNLSLKYQASKDKKKKKKKKAKGEAPVALTEEPAQEQKEKDKKKKDPQDQKGKEGQEKTKKQTDRKQKKSKKNKDAGQEGGAVEAQQTQKNQGEDCDKGNQKPRDSNRFILFMGNLPYRTTVEEITKYFADKEMTPTGVRMVVPPTQIECLLNEPPTPPPPP